MDDMMLKKVSDLESQVKKQMVQLQAILDELAKMKGSKEPTKAEMIRKLKSEGFGVRVSPLGLGRYP